jgi:hypothetical protein
MFNLGRLFDPRAHRLSDQPLKYDPGDLTTHAVCVGMTGSGKTGLCIDLLEEAALQGLPAILIDPKGDIADLLLQFPDLKPEDFQPWVNVDDARRAKLALPEFAARKAAEWRAGLAQWGLGPADIRRLKDAVEWTVYTPGSEAGRSVSILHSLEAPELPWAENQEALRERIAGICSALLGLIGLEADPVKSREHILLANIFETAWKTGQPLDLAALITQVQTPPFAKLGVFEVERFYPEKDRMELALALNAIIAAPSFQSWITGEPLDIPSLLQTPEGKPRVSIFYVAHLTEAERMFFIALLLEQIGAWLRGQAGTTSLRGLLYFDEVYGYLPPYPRNPSTKAPLLRLLKQARAFGLGVMLVTQNPGDLDYKGLTNTGTWLIGKLQTERDKDRLLEGLETISSQSTAAFDRDQLDVLISSLAPRTFLLQNVHAPEPVVFQTRWAMSYLAGPLTREQIRALTPRPAPPSPEGTPTAPLAAVKPTTTTAVTAAAPRATVSAAADGRRPKAEAVSQKPPAANEGQPQYILPPVRSLEDSVAAWRAETGKKRAQFGNKVEMIYRPALLAQAVVRYIVAKADLNSDKVFAFLLPADRLEAALRWDDSAIPPLDPASLHRSPAGTESFAAEVPLMLTDPKKLGALQKDLTAYLYRTAALTIYQNPTLKLYTRPDQTREQFAALCQQTAETHRAEELDKLRGRYDKKLEVLTTRLATERREMEADRAELEAPKAETFLTDVGNVIGLPGSVAKHRLAEKTKNEMKDSATTMAELEAQISALRAEHLAALRALDEKWSAAAQDIQDLRVTPKRADILMDIFGLAWLPYWQIDADGQMVEIAAFLA